ncbi:hypothetical protein EVAR_61956_1 [Eumeta japonica]|uniref:Uncharacterized protein n=1 Tax=Eumeta variegata TaxID=151549 RepID=A0A4C1ZIP0_EUMVA|nr:hypothetical protein EVAR_61956_1 [Eumeta japonica]
MNFPVSENGVERQSKQLCYKTLQPYRVWARLRLERWMRRASLALVRHTSNRRKTPKSNPGCNYCLTISGGQDQHKRAFQETPPRRLHCARSRDTTASPARRIPTDWPDRRGLARHVSHEPRVGSRVAGAREVAEGPRSARRGHRTMKGPICRDKRPMRSLSETKPAAVRVIDTIKAMSRGPAGRRGAGALKLVTRPPEGGPGHRWWRSRCRFRNTLLRKH